MKTFYVFNFNENSFKTLTAISIATELSKNYKTILLDFDSLSSIEKIFDKTHKIKLFSKSINLKLRQELEVIKVDVLNNVDDFRNEFINWFDKLKNIIQKYEYIIIDSSSSQGIINELIFLESDKVICPLNISSDNSDEILKYFINLSNVFSKKMKINFIGLSTNNDKTINASLYLKIKKKLFDLLPNQYIEINEKLNLKEQLKNDDIKNQYNNIINFLISI